MTIAALIVLAYLIGSIPSGLWIGQHFFNIDIRQHGSGNMGTTNAFRILGKKAGSIVLILDIVKGAIPTALAILFTPTISPLIIGIFAILGHTFPIFAQFKGGKAVATTTGVLLIANPTVISIAFIIFIITLYFSRMVSLSSIVSSAITMIITLFFGDILLSIVIVAIGIFIIYRHKSNITRIMNGTENKVPFGYGYKK